MSNKVYGIGLILVAYVCFANCVKLESPSALFFLKHLDLDGDARLSIDELAK